MSKYSVIFEISLEAARKEIALNATKLSIAERQRYTQKHVGLFVREAQKELKELMEYISSDFKVEFLASQKGFVQPWMAADPDCVQVFTRYGWLENLMDELKRQALNPWREANLNLIEEVTEGKPFYREGEDPEDPAVQQRRWSIVVADQRFYKAICRATGMSDALVKKAIAALDRAGIIAKKRKFNKVQCYAIGYHAKKYNGQHARYFFFLRKEEKENLIGLRLNQSR
ncbi:MAG: hypothetical protein RRB13_16155 [bacterium]|nr:hypothetical protein [bacterium]